MVQYNLEGLLQFSSDLSVCERELKNINDGIRDIRNAIAKANMDGELQESLIMVIRHMDKNMEQLSQMSRSIHKLSELSVTIGEMYHSCENHICELADGENIHRDIIGGSLVDLQHFHTFVTKWDLRI